MVIETTQPAWRRRNENAPSPWFRLARAALRCISAGGLHRHSSGRLFPVVSSHRPPADIHRMWRSTSHYAEERDDDSSIDLVDVKSLCLRHQILMVTSAGLPQCLTIAVFSAEPSFPKLWQIDQTPDAHGICNVLGSPATVNVTKRKTSRFLCLCHPTTRLGRRYTPTLTNGTVNRTSTPAFRRNEIAPPSNRRCTEQASQILLLFLSSTTPFRPARPLRSRKSVRSSCRSSFPQLPRRRQETSVPQCPP